MKFAKVMFLQASVCPQGGEHVWLLGGCAWLRGGVCVVALGGMHGCSWGACMVAPGGHVWLLRGGRAWLLWGGMHGCFWGGVHGFFGEIRSMSGWYASYWNAFLFNNVFSSLFFLHGGQRFPLMIRLVLKILTPLSISK